MRLMLGVGNEPSLLVVVDNNYCKDDFKFTVVNGYWPGRLRSGELFIDGDTQSSGRLEILCDSQDRLRGDYSDVFNNFDNLNYIAPKDVSGEFDIYDDDVPF